jgi:uncharacterized membrane protein
MEIGSETLLGRMKRAFGTRIRNVFITGLIVFTPLAVTVYVVWITFNLLDGFLRPIVVALLGKTIPGLSLLLTLLLILLLGAFARAAIGQKAIEYLERSLSKVPLLRSIYSAIKGASVAFLMPRSEGFKQVVLVEYPRKGIYALAFTTGESVGEIQRKTESKTINVFVPTSPNPTSGFFLMVPEKDVIPLSISVEEALKFVITGGLSTKTEVPAFRRADEDRERPS